MGLTFYIKAVMSASKWGKDTDELRPHCLQKFRGIVFARTPLPRGQGQGRARYKAGQVEPTRDTLEPDPSKGPISALLWYGRLDQPMPFLVHINITRGHDSANVP